MKRKKIWYVPGMISILCLPVLLYFFGPEEPVRETAFRILIPSEKPDTGEVRILSKHHVYESMKRKKVVSVYLDTERRYDEGLHSYMHNAKFQFLKREIERHQFTHDTNTVMRVVLGEENTYDDFMWVLNQTIVYDIKRWVYVDDSIYLLAQAPPEPPVYVESSPIDVGSYNYPDYEAPSRLEIFLKDLGYRLELLRREAEHNRLLVSGFFVFIVMPATIALIRTRKRLTPDQYSK